MKAKAIKITVDKEISIIDIPRKGIDLLEALRTEIGGWIELVHPRTFHNNKYLQGKVMVVYEDGIRKRKKPNLIGTKLYGNHSTIVGDVLILKDIFTEYGMDVGGLTDDEANQLYEYLKRQIQRKHGGKNNE